MTTVAPELDRARLIEDHVGIVRAIAWDLIRHGCPAEAEDLVGDGMVGLCGAAARFDPGRGVAFQSWAWPRVKGAMLDGMRRRDELSRSARQRTTAVDKARFRFAAREQRFPTTDELAAEAGLTPEQLGQTECLAEFAQPLSLDMEVMIGQAPTDEPTLLGDLVPDPFRDTAREALHQLDKDRLPGMLARLKPREQLVLSMYFWEDMMLREIAPFLDVTESRVSQILTRALEQLREILTPEDLADAA